MIYDYFEYQRALFTPWKTAIQAMQSSLRAIPGPQPLTPFARAMLGAVEAISALGESDTHRNFGFETLEINGKAQTITEQHALDKPFCELIRFDYPGVDKKPKLLLCAPMSGHKITLLHSTMQELIPNFNVHVTRWRNARDVAKSHGRFGLNEYMDYINEFITHMGEAVHIICVCQPSVPVLACCSVLAENNSPLQPRSLTLIAGPVDTRLNPTSLTAQIISEPLVWYESVVIAKVPPAFAGVGRKVFPGFYQLASLIGMNLDKHADAQVRLWQGLMKGDSDFPLERQQRFQAEFMSVIDLPAEFYLDTLRTIFFEHHLANGTFEWHGHRVKPEAMTKTALLTVEGGLDDIVGHGETKAAHDLCTGLSEENRGHLDVFEAGHYRLFTGHIWREKVAPAITEFILNHD